MTSARVLARGRRPTADCDWLQETDGDAHARGQNDEHGEEVDDEEEEDEVSSSKAVSHSLSVHESIDFVKPAHTSKQ